MAEMSKPKPTVFTVLVTGANSGLGFGICCRLIDEFLLTRPATQTLHLLFSTRDARKSAATLRRLEGHLFKSVQSLLNGVSASVAASLTARVRLEGVSVNLLELKTVKALAQQLLARAQQLDAVIWNAGIAGWDRIDWPRAIWAFLTDCIQASTFPGYVLGKPNMIAKPQGTGGEEPKLGEVFLSNVFAYYLLTHWLLPLLTPESRIIWISSTTALPKAFDASDIQGLKGIHAYESSKRLIDTLVLTSELPSIRPYSDALLQPSSQQQAKRTPNARPKMYLTHPGVVGSSISGLPWFMDLAMVLVLYLARLLGSPWQLISPYKGAVAPVYAALSPASQLPELEEREGKGKWGSACDVWGNERVGRTDAAGWGFTGVVGVVPPGSVTSGKGLERGWRATDREMREGFEHGAREVWREMEEMRVEWEKRLGPI